MKELFSMQGPLYRVLEVITELLMLNLLFVVGALPLVTVGASAIALYGSVRSVKDDGARARRFFSLYRKHLMQGIVLEVGGFGLFVALASLLWLVSHLGFAGQCLELFLLVIAAVLLLAMPYVFALPTARVMGVMATVKTAISMCMAHMAVSITMALITLMVMAAAVMAWKLFFIWIFLAFAAIAWLHDGIMSRLLVGKQSRNVVVHP
ncbi:MAG: DUF624 domain-containing protein [Bifidobacterium sp.]|jgi:uncharacterized membrane protein YesL|nr:DUF624 domain-containing protein [Bifidobacterium sp.]